MESIYKLVQIFVSVFEIYLVFDFFSSFFPLRKILRNKYAQTGIVFGLSLCVCIVNSFGSSSLNLVSMLVMYLLLVLLAFEGDLLKKILYYIMVHVIMGGSEFLFIVLLSHPSDFSLREIKENPFSMIVILISVKLLTFLIFTIVKRISKNSNSRMDIKNFIIYTIVPVSLLGIMIAIAYLNIDFDSLGKIKFLLLGGCTLGMIGNVLIFYSFDRYFLSLEKLQQQDIMIAKLETEEKHYEQIEKINQEHAALLHDIHHYLRTIGEAAKENKDTDILNIISELQVRVSDESKIIYCSNRLLNVLLNEKRKSAEEAGIKITLKIENGFYMKQIADLDLIAIVGNVLDNAIEAAAQCEKGYIKVYMFMQNENHYSVMKVENNYSGTILVKDEKILTSKADKGHHGIGIQNITSIMEKYDGSLQMFYENQIFTSIILLPVQTEQNLQK